MDRNEVRHFILEMIREKRIIFNISEAELKDSFDLVKSGLLDSMAFIDLIAAAEDNFNLEIDFEIAADSPGFTSLGGLVDIIVNAQNA